jgi:hypothetical protein
LRRDNVARVTWTTFLHHSNAMCATPLIQYRGCGAGAVYHYANAKIPIFARTTDNVVIFLLSLLGTGRQPVMWAYPQRKPAQAFSVHGGRGLSEIVPVKRK